MKSSTTPHPALVVEGAVTVTTEGGAVRITGGEHGQLRIEVADIASLRKLQDASNALPQGSGGKRESTRLAAETLDQLGLTAEILVAGQRIAQLGRGIKPDTIARLMHLGPIDVDKSAVLKLGRQLLQD